MKTQFSRRELYALGEPLGESATRVVAGRRIYGGGGGIGGIVSGVGDAVGGAVNGVFGGGGGGSSPAPAQQGGAFSNTSPTQQAPSNVSPMSQTDAQQGIAGYAQPYVNTMLGATMQNLFNYDQNGNATGLQQYNPYSYNPADYVAGFSPLQQQVQQGVANMQVPGQYAQATSATQDAINRAQNAQYNPQTGGYSSVNAPSLQNFQMGPAERIGTQQFTGNQVGQYMNPYLQNALQPQLQEIQRQYDITGQQEAGNAVKQGAFGGSRQALMQAENQRNKNMAMNQAIGQGYNTAYQNAANQFNTSQGQNLQAQAANQQAGLTTGQNNLNALLGVQSLGAGQNLTAQQSNQAARQAAQNLAAQQQQFGANYGLANLQQQLAGANQLGNLGTQQLGAQQGIYGLQNQIGQQQQQQQQNIINQGVQNYQTAQQYPMQQLTQMKNMLAGLPVTTTSTQNYQAAPTNLQNLMALGMGGAGISSLLNGGSSGRSGTGGSGGSSGGGISGLLNSGAGLIGDAWNGISGAFGFADGGQVKGYAQGGVTSEDNVRSIANFLPTQQLPKSYQAAQGRGDFDAQNALQQEMAERASIERGLGGAFNQLPPATQQNVVRAAGGGIIAFKNRGVVADDSTADDATDGATEDMELDGLQLSGGPGGPLQQQAARQALETGRQAGALRYIPSPEDIQRKRTEAYFKQFESLGGPNPYEPMQKSLEERRNAMADNMSQAKGLAALKAMSGMLQPGGAMRGLGNAAGSFADSMEKAQAAEQAEKRAIELMNFNLADAQRKERMGLTKDAMAANAAAEKNKLDAINAQRAALQAKGNIEARVAQALRGPGAGAGAGGAGKVKVNEQLAAAEIAYANDPSPANLKTVKALRDTVDRIRTSEAGPGKLGVATATNDVRYKTLVQKALGELRVDPKYMKATPAEQKVMENAEEARIRAQPLPAETNTISPPPGYEPD